MKNTVSGNESRGFMKLIVDADTDTVVGIHMIGPDCAEIMQVEASKPLQRLSKHAPLERSLTCVASVTSKRQTECKYKKSMSTWLFVFTRNKVVRVTTLLQSNSIKC